MTYNAVFDTNKLFDQLNDISINQRRNSLYSSDFEKKEKIKFEQHRRQLEFNGKKNKAFFSLMQHYIRRQTTNKRTVQ